VDHRAFIHFHSDDACRDGRRHVHLRHFDRAVALGCGRWVIARGERRGERGTGQGALQVMGQDAMLSQLTS
jgi:hypothetical protein